MRSYNSPNLYINSASDESRVKWNVIHIWNHFVHSQSFVQTDGFGSAKLRCKRSRQTWNFEQLSAPAYNSRFICSIRQVVFFELFLNEKFADRRKFWLTDDKLYSRIRVRGKSALFGAHVIPKALSERSSSTVLPKTVLQFCSSVLFSFVSFPLNKKEKSAKDLRRFQSSNSWI